MLRLGEADWRCRVLRTMRPDADAPDTRIGLSVRDAGALTAYPHIARRREHGTYPTGALIRCQTNIGGRDRPGKSTLFMRALTGRGIIKGRFKTVSDSNSDAHAPPAMDACRKPGCARGVAGVAGSAYGGTQAGE